MFACDLSQVPYINLHPDKHRSLVTNSLEPKAIDIGIFTFFLEMGFGEFKKHERVHRGAISICSEAGRIEEATKFLHETAIRPKQLASALV